MKPSRRTLRAVILLAVILVWMAESAAGSPYRARRRTFGADHPVARSHISNVQQDSSGLMWFATWDGILRFDGINSHSFRPIALSDGAISSNRIYKLKFDAGGLLWCVSSDDRIYTFDQRTQRFTDVQAGDSLLRDNRVRNLVHLRNGVTWAIMRDGTAVRFEGGDRTFSDVRDVSAVCITEKREEWVIGAGEARNHTLGYGIPGRWVNIYSINGRTVAIGRDGRVAEFDARGAAVRRFAPLGPVKAKINYTMRVDDCVLIATDAGIYGVNLLDGKEMKYSSHAATYLYKDSRGRVWAFGDPSRVTLMDDPDEGGATELHTLPAPVQREGRPQHIAMEDAAGNVIVMPRGGVLSRYNPVSGQLDPVEVPDAAGLPGCYSSAEIKKFLVDHDRNLWVFHQAGADCITFLPECFEYRRNPSGAEVRALMADSRGRLWTADRDNLLRVGPDRWLTPSGTLSAVARPLTSYPVYVLRESPDGSVWAGTKGDGLYIISPRADGRFDISHLLSSPSDPRSLRSDTIYDIKFAPDGRVWLGSYGGGLSQGRRAGDRWEFENVPGQPRGLKIRSIHETADALALATAEGLVVMDKKSGRFGTVTGSASRSGLNGNDIMGFASVADTSYFCVFGGGLYSVPERSLTSAGIRFRQVSLPPETAPSRLRGMACDGRRLWITDEYSLTGYDTSAGRCVNFGSESFGNQISLSEAAPVIVGDTIFIGASSGVLRFVPAQVIEHRPRRRIAITGVRYRNSAEITPMANPDSLVVDPDHRSFALCISAMEYDSPGSAHFRWRLADDPEGWSYVEGPQPTVAFDNLSAGTHLLEIEVTDHDGNWQRPGRVFTLEVTPRMTETLWFSLLMALLASAVVCGVIWFILYLRRMRNLIQNKYSLLMAADRIHSDFGIVSGDTSPRDDRAARQREFVEKCTAYVIANISNPDMVVEDLARHMGMSRTALYSMMKGVAEVTPVDFIKQVRIKQALLLLDKGGKSISEVAYAVGFSDPKYFSRCFKAEMDMTPTQYLDWRHVQEN